MKTKTVSKTKELKYKNAKLNTKHQQSGQEQQNQSFKQYPFQLQLCLQSDSEQSPKLYQGNCKYYQTHKNVLAKQKTKKKNNKILRTKRGSKNISKRLINKLKQQILCNVQELNYNSNNQQYANKILQQTLKIITEYQISQERRPQTFDAINFEQRNNLNTAIGIHNKDRTHLQNMHLYSYCGQQKLWLFTALSQIQWYPFYVAAQQNLTIKQQQNSQLVLTVSKKYEDEYLCDIVQETQPKYTFGIYKQEMQENQCAQEESSTLSVQKLRQNDEMQDIIPIDSLEDLQCGNADEIRQQEYFSQIEGQFENGREIQQQCHWYLKLSNGLNDERNK